MNSTENRFTSIDYYINKFPNKIDEPVIDLQTLAETFSLDVELIEGKYVTTGEFEKLEYSEKIGKGSVEKLINRPPIGPIPMDFLCTYCEQYGPGYHSVDCPNPSKRELVLTYKGFKALLKNVDYDGPLLDDIKRYKKGEKLQVLNKYFEDFIGKVKENGKTVIKIPDNAFSEITYDEVVKIKGKDPQAAKTMTVRFSNIVSIYFTLGNKTTNVRIYKDGSIDVKNIPQDEDVRSNFFTNLVDKINKTGALIDNNYRKLLLKNSVPLTNNYTIQNDYSYFYLFHSQFYMFGEETRKEQEIDFDKLSDLIEPDTSNKYITVMDDENFLNIEDYDITIFTKLKKLAPKTDSKVYNMKLDSIDISLFITKYGVFQFSVSSKELSIDEVEDILNVIREFFISVFQNEDLTERTFITDAPMIYSMNETQDTTISGLVPPKSQSQRTGTEVCRKTQAGVALQPRPYSWTGVCASENYAPAIGVEAKYIGGDVFVKYNGKNQQLFYPCCEKLTGGARLKFIERLKKGFTKEEQEQYGIFPDRDILSGVLVPDSTKKGAITEVQLNNDDSYTKVEVVDVPKRVRPDAEYTVKRLSDSKLFKVSRLQFKRDTRYFRGLNSLSKKELISILNKNNMVTDGVKIDNRTIQDLNVNLNKFVYIHKDTILEDFTKNIYKLTYVPDETTLVILDYKNKQNQSYINISSSIKTKSGVEFINGSMVYGYLNEASNTFYPIYILGTDNLDMSLDIIERNLKGVQDTIEYPDYIDNYVEAADYYLKNENNIRLVFSPLSLDHTFYIFDEKLKVAPLTVQLLETLGTSRYNFGYNNKLLSDTSYYMSIPSSVRDGDYLEIQGRYNKITNEIDSLKPLEFVKESKKININFDKVLHKFEEIFNPIDIIFFTVNDGEYLQIRDVKLIFDEDTNLLIPDSA
jgi:hypothetical protein